MSDPGPGAGRARLVVEVGARPWRDLGAVPWAVLCDLAAAAVADARGWIAPVGAREIGASAGLNKDLSIEDSGWGSTWCDSTYTQLPCWGPGSSVSWTNVITPFVGEVAGNVVNCEQGAEVGIPTGAGVGAFAEGVGAGPGAVIGGVLGCVFNVDLSKIFG